QVGAFRRPPRGSPASGKVRVITAAVRQSAVHNQCAQLRSTHHGWARSHVGGGCTMNGFLKSTFTRQKFQGLFVSTAFGNFAAYVAGSRVPFASPRRALEGRAIGNLFGFLPRKKVVVHLLPHWLEWLLALLVGFLVMEAVRYVLNQYKPQ